MDALSEFTILACYCIYFSDTPSEYAHMFMNVSRAHQTDENTNEQITEAALIAIKLMQPNWKNKKVPSTKPVDVKAFLEESEQAEYEYKNVEWDGGQLWARLSQEKIKKLRQQIASAYSQKNKL